MAKINFTHFLILCLLLFPNSLWGQNDSLNSFLEVLTDISEEFSEDDNVALLLTEMNEHPIDINREPERLRELPFLTDSQVLSIVRFIKENNGITNLLQLLNVPDIGNDEIKRLKYFVSINVKKKTSYLNPGMKLRTRFSFANKEERSKENFLGNTLHSYQKLNLKLNENIYSDIVIEKDPGEKNFADYKSFSLSFRNLLNKFDFILGDYQIEFGQGLVLWNPYAFGKNSGNVLNVVKYAKNKRANTFAAENRFFRGIAIGSNFEHFDFTLFADLNNISASYDSTQNLITSIDFSGYHRTPAELNKMGKLKEKTFSAIANVLFPHGNRIGIAFVKSFFDKEISLKKFCNNFSTLSYVTVDYHLQTNKLSLDGETGWDFNSLATINALKLNVAKDLNIISLARYYSSNFISFYGKALGEGGNTNNEIGFYNGIFFNAKDFKLNFYYDIFSFPSPSSLSLFATRGNELSLELKTRLHKGIKFLFRIFRENKFFTDNSMFTKRSNNKVRLQATYGSSNKIGGKTRIEFSFFNETEKENGLLFFQDIFTRITSYVSIYFRAIYFNTKSYNSRIYEFENDLYGAMTNPALYGEGIRFYLLTILHPLRKIILEFKYTFQTRKTQDKKLFESENKVGIQLRIGI